MDLFILLILILLLFLFKLAKAKKDKGEDLIPAPRVKDELAARRKRKHH